MGTKAWFATREDIRSALDADSAARTDAQLDRALGAATRAVVGLCNRDFVPVLDTKAWDWPSEQTPRSWRLWLDQHDLITPTLILSAGVEIPATDYFLEPNRTGPPYTYLETRLDKPSVFSTGSTFQHAIQITGWWGYTDDQEPAGALVGAIDGVQTRVTVSDSSAVGVGHILTAGAERMTVTGKSLADTGQTAQTALDAKPSSQLLGVTDGTAYHEGETLTLGAERVEVRDIAGNTLIVKRAVDGTTLTAHTTGEAIWAPRALTVARAAQGTSASPAGDGTALTRWAPPDLVHTLAVAEAQNSLLNEQAGYLRTAGSSSGSSGGKEATQIALKDLRDQCYVEHGRKTRTRAV